MRRPLLLVLVVLAPLMLLSLGHGLPQRYVPDDHSVRCALGIARDLGNPDLSRLSALVPPSGQYTTYPYLLAYLDLGAVAVVYVGGRLAGAWAGAGAFGEAVFADATLAWLPARLISVLLALLLPLAVYRSARRLGRGRRGAALAALLGGSSLLLVQGAHVERPWAPVAAFVAVTLAASLRLRRRRRVRDVVLACLPAGLAVATHPIGVLAFGLPVLAALVWRLRPAAVVAGLGAGLLVALLLGYPYLLVYQQDTGRGAIAGQLEASDVVDIGGQAFALDRFHGQLALRTLRGWFGYEPVLLVLGLLGLPALARAARGRGATLLVVPPLFLAVLFLAYDGTHVRYLLPATAFLALSAALLVERLARAGAAGTLAALLLVALPLLQAARLDVVLGRQDTRSQAALELPALLPPGERVAVDGYGPPLVPTAASVDAIDELVWTTRTETRALDLAHAGVPEPAEARDLIPVGRFWKFDSYYPRDYELGEQPKELSDWMDEWGIRSYVQSDRLPDPERRRPVTELTARRGRLVYALSPATDGGVPREALLPAEMLFPLTELWRTRQPGPLIRCWRIEAPPR